MNEIINRVSIIRKGQETKTYLLPSVTDLLTDGSIKQNHIDWGSVKKYLDALYVGKDTYTTKIASIEAKIPELEIDSVTQNLKYGGQVFLNVNNYESPSDLTEVIEALQGDVSEVQSNIEGINTTLNGLDSRYVQIGHNHTFLNDLTDITEDVGYIKIESDEEDTEPAKFIEFLSDKLIDLHVRTNGGGDVYVTPRVRKGEKAILVAEPAENYEFVHWTQDLNEISKNAVHILNNVTTEATYFGIFQYNNPGDEPQNYTIKVVKPTGGDIIANVNNDENSLEYNSSVSLAQGTIINLSAVSDSSEHYIFTKWTSGVPQDSIYDTNTSITLNADTIISAAFSQLLKVTLGVAKDVNGATITGNHYPTVKIGNISQNEHEFYVQPNTTISLEADTPIENYYYFKYWSDDHTATNEVRNNVSITSTFTTYPVYERKHTITFKANPTNYGTVTAKIVNTNGTLGDTITSGTSLVSETKVRLIPEAASGYQFSSWSVKNNVTTVNSSNEITITNSDLEITANFISAAKGSVTFGYRNTTQFVKFDNNIVVTLNNTQNLTNPYEVTSQEILNANDLSVSDSQYVFDHFEDSQGEVIDTENRLTIVVGQAYYCVFAIPLTVSTSAGEHGSITGGGTHNKYSTCTLTATPDSGYHVEGWYEVKNGSEVKIQNQTSNTYEFTVTSNISIRVKFAINTYSVKVKASPTNGGTVSLAENTTVSEMNVNYGSTPILYATAATGYELSGWKKGSGSIINGSNVSPYEVTTAITADTTFTAVFTESVDDTIYYFASTNNDYSPAGKTINTLEIDSTTNQLTTQQLVGIDTLVFLSPSTMTITSIKDVIAGTEIISKFLTHSTTYNGQEYTAYYYTDPYVEINGRFIVQIGSN